MRRLNIALVVKILAYLGLSMALFMVVPFVLALVMGDSRDVFSFLVPILVGGLPSLGVALFLKAPQNYLGPREGFLLVTSGWVAVSAVGALPFVLSGALPSYHDAYFETMSGFTTTGASVFTDVEVLSNPILLWRSLTHWLGGMGVIALTVAVLPALGVSGMNLLRAETPGPDVDKVTPKLNETAKILWLIYVGLTVVQILLLNAAGMGLFDAINHAFATMATGGFSTKNAGLAYWNVPSIHWISTIFMTIAGVNFVVYYRVITGRFASLPQNTELKAYLLIFLVTSLLAGINLYSRGVYETFEESIRIGAFQISTILTTTGFSIADYNLWPGAVQALILVTMFIGGSTGSTGGGVKVLRLVSMAKLAYHEATRMLHPRGVFAIRINGKPVHKDLLYPVAGFIFTYIAIALLSTVVVSSQGYDLVTSFTSVLAALGNIGPGFGMVGPVNNYSFYPPAIKWFLSFLMLLGRLELWTVLVLFMPRFWKR